MESTISLPLSERRHFFWWAQYSALIANMKAGYPAIIRI